MCVVGEETEKGGEKEKMEEEEIGYLVFAQSCDIMMITWVSIGIQLVKEEVLGPLSS